METQLYLYQGSVKSFGRIMTPEYKCYTEAPSLGKALSNVSYRYKKERGFSVNTRIELNPVFMSVIDVGSIAPDEE